MNAERDPNHLCSGAHKRNIYDIIFVMILFNQVLKILIINTWSHVFTSLLGLRFCLWIRDCFVEYRNNSYEHQEYMPTTLNHLCCNEKGAPDTIYQAITTCQSSGSDNGTFKLPINVSFNQHYEYITEICKSFQEFYEWLFVCF